LDSFNSRVGQNLTWKSERESTEFLRLEDYRFSTEDFSEASWEGCRLRNYPRPAVLWTMLPPWNIRQLLVFLAVPARFRASENSSSRFKMVSKRETKLTSE